MTARPRLALIGSGKIADFHVPACREAGFDVVAVAGSLGSARAVVFAQRFGIPKVWNDPRELAASPEGWDAMLIASSVESTLELLIVAAAANKPILVEKPVSTSSAALAPYVNAWPHVIVAYNRRFYATVHAAREFARAGGPCLVQLELPESAPVRHENGTVSVDTRAVLGNSVHGLDVARYVLGDLHVEAVVGRGEGSGRDGSAAILRSSEGHVVQYVGNWNASSNFALTLDRGRSRYQARPFELGTYYEGMEVVEPTPETPIRRYLPKRTGEVQLSATDLSFKPGFVGQSRELMALRSGKPAEHAATLADAYAAVRLAEAVLGVE